LQQYAPAVLDDDRRNNARIQIVDVAAAFTLLPPPPLRLDHPFDQVVAANDAVPRDGQLFRHGVDMIAAIASLRQRFA
jgi:hypothetical protein